MKKFSKYWKSSSNVSKQRQYNRNAPLHLRNKFVSSRLSKELSKKYEMRNAPLRKGDKVKIMRGQFKNKTGKVGKISLVNMKIFVEGIDQMKIEGGKSPYPLHPSNLMITEINTEDKRRFKRSAKKEK